AVDKRSRYAMRRCVACDKRVEFGMRAADIPVPGCLVRAGSQVEGGGGSILMRRRVRRMLSVFGRACLCRHHRQQAQGTGRMLEHGDWKWRINAARTGPPLRA